MRSVIMLLVVSFTIYSSPRFSCAKGSYLLEESSVLLYKIINWWYDASGEESVQLCGDKIRYVQSGVLDMDFEEEKSTITITLDDFSSLLSVNGGCKSGSHSTTFKAALMNEQLFSETRATLVIEESRFTNSYQIVLENVGDELFVDLLTEVQGWIFTLGGKLAGLKDGKVSLTSDGDCLAKCSGSGVGAIEKDIPFFTASRKIDGAPLLRFDLLNGEEGGVTHKK